MHISKSIVINIGDDVIKAFLREQKIPNEKLVSAQNIENLISDLLDQGLLSLDALEEFLFNELMYGKRRYIRVFKLDKIKDIKYKEDWLGVLCKEYNIKSLEFNNIISTYVTDDAPDNIAAIHTECDEKGEIKKISILFVFYIKMKDSGNSLCYIPVEFDFIKKLIVIKSWRRQGIYDDEKYKPSFLMDKTIQWLENSLTYSKKSMSDIYKEVLYNMTKGLVEELFDKIPSYEDAMKLDTDICSFSNSILDKMGLENKILNKDGTYSLPYGIMDIKDELLKLIQRLTVSDYFMNREFDEVWDMGISAIVNSVKFNDKDNVLAVVSGEDKRKPVFCAKSFLVLLKSIEDSKEVDTIWIAFKYDKKTIRINYDASNDDYYLEIGVLSNQRSFTQKEFEYIWEILTRYESDNNTKIEKVDQAIVG
ncbi:hypothetical protein JW813_03170 [Clostridium botulinum]|uniref:hypothetical protein n=1 Tax=Clostridium botulinum TaxID=1491 RepID=UPI00224640AC|nr:hypothetical protein [Clostridium botulinum]UZP04014.1 hypothetical protein JW813_03170 [Clostridium botulinum]UZP07370.1 hypothetical protein JYA71_03165 [Clostridium botulinum]UZP10752.1 hypothetical protein JYA74_03165 [Clostridium botulinum]